MMFRSRIPHRMSGLAVVMAGAAALGACNDKPATVQTPPVVRTMVVALSSDVTARSYTGVVRARHEIAQGFRVAGKIVERLVDVGDEVKTGQALARLDPRDLELQVGSAEAELAAAAAAVAQAQADAKRAETLSERNYASLADFDRRRLALEETRGRLTRATRQLELARNQLSYTTLSATADGIITTALGEPGQVVALGEAVMRIARLDEREIAVAIPEIRLADLDSAKAVVSLWADPSRRYEARLRELAPEADATTRTYAARFTLPAAPAAARLGMTATVSLEKGTGQTIARVPLAAVADEGHGPFVYVVDAAEKLTRRAVTVLRYGVRDVDLATGVAEGERVVTLGVDRLTPEQRVRVAEAK